MHYSGLDPELADKLLFEKGSKFVTSFEQIRTCYFCYEEARELGREGTEEKAYPIPVGEIRKLQLISEFPRQVPYIGDIRPDRYQDLAEFLVAGKPNMNAITYLCRRGHVSDPARYSTKQG